jgi:hypothetical protein
MTYAAALAVIPKVPGTSDAELIATARECAVLRGEALVPSETALATAFEVAPAPTTTELSALATTVLPIATEVLLVAEA